MSIEHMESDEICRALMSWATRFAEKQRASETPGVQHQRSPVATGCAPNADDAVTSLTTPSPGEVRISQPGTPTPRGSLPTRDEMADAIDGELPIWFARRDVLDAADAAIKLYAPHVAALEATARQAEEENARLRERVAEVEKELRHSTGRENELRNQSIESHRWQSKAERERDAALARAEKAESVFRRGMGKPEPAFTDAGGLPAASEWRIVPPTSVPVTWQSVMHAWQESWDGANRETWERMAKCLNASTAPPPSASAGTGTISDEELARSLCEHFGKQVGRFDLGDNYHRENWLRVARRAKELLGGSKAVKLPERPSAGSPYLSWSDDYVCGWDAAIEAVRAALAGRGETENG